MSSDNERGPQRLESGLEARNHLQLLMVERMLGEKPTDDDVLKWVERYAKIVSDIIDNPEEVEVRDAISRNDYERAIGLILPRLETHT